MKYLLAAIIILLFSPVNAQKVSYKKVISVYQKGDTLQGNNLLLDYFSTTSNIEFSHAYLMMGKYYKTQLCEVHLLAERSVHKDYSDTAKYFLRKAKETLTEKELNKNIDDYKAFERRNVRTGDLEISLYDIQYNIENEINWIDQRKENLENIYKEVDKLKSLYGLIQSDYNALVNGKRALNEVYMGAGLSTLSKLDNINITASKFEDQANLVNRELDNVTCTKTRIDIVYKSMEGFYLKLSDTPNFYSRQVEIYNFSQWAIEVRNTIINDVLSIKTDLQNYNDRLSTLYMASQNGEFITENKLVQLDKVLDREKIIHFDPKPLPLTLFELLKSEILYNNYDREIVDEGKNNLELYYQNVKEQYNIQLKQDSLLNVIRRSDIDRQLRNYDDFFTRIYGGLKGLEEFLKIRIDNNQINKKRLREEVATLSDRIRYIDLGGLHIPIHEKDRNLAFRPLFNSDNFVLGIKYGENGKKLYLVEKTPTLVADSVYEVSMDSILHGKEYEILHNQTKNGLNVLIVQISPTERKMVPKINNKEITYFYYDHYRTLLINIDFKANRVNWTKSFVLSGKPEKIKENNTGGITISYTNIDEKPEDKEIDRDGKLMEL